MAVAFIFLLAAFALSPVSPLRFESASKQEFTARGPNGLRLTLSPTSARMRGLRLDLVASNGSSTGTGIDPLPGKSNYLIGSDPARWRAGVAAFRRVRFDAVYPGVDLLYYGNE